MYIPLHLSAPEYVLLLVHVDREMLVLALLDGIRPGGDSSHFVKLAEEKREQEKYWSMNPTKLCVSHRLTHLNAAFKDRSTDKDSDFVCSR